MTRTPTSAAQIGSALIVLPLLAVAVYFCGVAFNSFVPMAWNSWSANAARIESSDSRIAKIEKMAQEQEYGTVCPKYFSASYATRIWSFRDLAWCEQYKDKMVK